MTYTYTLLLGVILLFEQDSLWEQQNSATVIFFIFQDDLVKLQKKFILTKLTTFCIQIKSLKQMILEKNIRIYKNRNYQLLLYSPYHQIV